MVILGANIKLYQFDFQGTVDYVEKLEVRQALEAKRRRRVERADKTNLNKSQGNKNKAGLSKPQSKYSKCAHSCGHTNHATNKDFWFSPENKGKSKTGKKSLDKTVMMTTEQLNMILERLIPRNSKSGMRKVCALSPVQSDTENVTMFGPKTKISKVDTNDYSDEDSIYLGLNTNHESPFHCDDNSPKRQNYFTRPLRSWDKYMVLIQTVSYVYGCGALDGACVQCQEVAHFWQVQAVVVLHSIEFM